jgi:hypothetical protein
MKKITLLLIAATMALSCSDDDNTPVSLDGTWKLAHATLGFDLEHGDVNNDGIVSENFVDEQPCLGDATIVFNANDSAVFSPTCFSNEYLPQTLTYTTSGNTTTFVYDSLETPGLQRKVTFKRSGNTLIATLSYEDNSYIPGDGDYGDVNSILWDATVTYTKQ